MAAQAQKRQQANDQQKVSEGGHVAQIRVDHVRHAQAHATRYNLS